MDYYGLLFLYYLKGLSGKSVLKLFFNIEAGGAEQLLPENTSVPTTTPILADIQYPDGLRTDQYFTYRETPTTVSNKARIKTIKGNTLVWNQLSIVPFTETRGGVTFTRNDDKTTLQMSGTSTSTIYKQFSEMPMATVGHVYYVDKGADSTLFQLYNDGGGINTETNRRAIGTATAQKNWFFRIPNGTTIDVTAKPMIIDLTVMFGSGNEPTTVEEFTSLFSLPYYAYNQGTLLSFMGNGIKTVGKNLFDFSQFANGTITFENGDLKGTAGQFSASYSNVVSNGIELKYPENTQITISFDARTEQNDAPSGNGIYLMASENGTSTRIARATNETTSIQHITATIPSNRHIDKLGWTYGANALNIWHITNFQVEFGATETSYEPYTTSTTSLPISTYFPSGMKSAGNVYDELTPTKGITRIGAVDLGSLGWVANPNVSGGFNCRISDMKLGVSGEMSSLICPLYETINTKYYGAMNTMQNMQIAQSKATQGELYLINTSYSDATAFKTAMSGVYLYYELATESETPITTEDANEALSLLMGKSVSSDNANQLINIITKGE